MVGVARGPGKTTCKKCSRSVGTKALKITTSYGSYHVNCWKPPRPFTLSEFSGFGALDDAGKASFTKTVEKWLEPYRKQEEKIQVHNELANTKRRQIDEDHKALKVVEGFDPFNAVPTMVLSLVSILTLSFCSFILFHLISPSHLPHLFDVQTIAGWLDGMDLKEVPLVSKHWSVACKDDLVWKGACRLYPAAEEVHSKLLGKTWKHVYNVLTNSKEKQGFCVECANPTSYNSMFSCFLCPKEDKRMRYKSISDLKRTGLTSADVTKYGIRAAMGNVAVEYYEPTFHRREIFYSLADVINAQKQKAVEKVVAQKRKHVCNEDEEEEEEEKQKGRKKRG